MRAGSSAIGAATYDLVSDLLEIDESDIAASVPSSRQLYPGTVTIGEIRDYLRERARTLFPEAVVIDSYRLPRGGVDLAIFSDRATVGILISGSDDSFARPRKAPGIDAFDHAIAIVARPHLDHLDALPPTVQRFVARYDEGRLAFVPTFSPEGGAHDRGAAQARTPTAILSVLPRRQLVVLARSLPGRRSDKSDPSFFDRCLQPAEARRLVREAVAKHDTAPGPLVGRAIADALLDRLAATTPAPAAVVREMAITAYTGGVADLALATPTGLHLFEVKGETDSAARLARQVAAYDAVGSTCTLVTTWRHLTAFSARIPEHWGLLVAERVEDGSCCFRSVRLASPNPHQRPEMLTLRLLTGDLHAILRRVCKGKPWRYSAVHRLRDLVVQTLDHATLITVVARAVALRKTLEQRRTAAILVGVAQDWPGLDAILGCGGVDGPIFGQAATVADTPS